MKLTLISFLFLLLLGGCDVIDKNNYQVDYTPPVPEGADVRRILLEDYTGVRCPNCPKAAAKAGQLKELYGERLVVVAVHAGFYARPIDDHDFRTEAGTAYSSHFKISGYPQGVVSRLPYQGVLFFSPDIWAGALEVAPAKSPLGVEVYPSFDAITRTYSVKVEVSAFDLKKMPQAADLILWLVEDNIIGSQMLEDGKTIEPNYVHRHVFRAALNGTWGEPLVNFPPTLGASLSVESSGYTLAASFDALNCSVVALLSDPITKEVYQVSEESLVRR